MKEMENSIDDNIKVLQVKIAVEHDPQKKQILNLQLQKLQLQKEIDTIKNKIVSLS